MTFDWWTTLQGDLCWHQTHGSGFTFSRSDLLVMPVKELLEMHEDVHRRRKEEADEIKRAASRKH